MHKALRRFFDLFQFSFIHEQSFQTKFTTKENPKLLGKIRKKNFFQNHKEKILFYLNFTRAKNSHEQKKIRIRTMNIGVRTKSIVCRPGFVKIIE